MASKKNLESARRFLWEDEESITSASARSRNSQGTTGAFSTRDYSVDQSVNLHDMQQDIPLDMGSSNHVRSTSGATRLSGGPGGQTAVGGVSRLSGAMAGLFRANTGTESITTSSRTAPRFDEYGDAAPSADAEEYISTKNRRRLGPMSASCAQAWSACGRIGFAGRKGIRLACLVVALALVGGGVYFAVSKLSSPSSSSSDSGTISDIPNVNKRFHNLQNRIVNAHVTPQSAFDSQSSPQRKAVEWLARDDPARGTLPSDHEAMLDRYALAVFYFSSTNAPSTDSTASSMTTASGNSWQKADGWMSGKGICAWHGVECLPREQEATAANDFTPFTRSYDDNARITALKLNENNVEGIIPNELAALEQLVTLDLQNNDLSSTIPTALGKLKELRDLLLRHNSLVGSLPSELGAITKLHQLHLASNGFEGDVPTELSTIHDMRSLALSHNLFTGSFPDLSKMTRLSLLYLDDNDFTGTIPEYMETLTDLRKYFDELN